MYAFIIVIFLDKITLIILNTFLLAVHGCYNVMPILNLVITYK